MTRVLFLMPTYYPDSSAGAERQATILARAIRQKGAAVIILAPIMDASATGTRIESGVTVVRLPASDWVFLGGRHTAAMLRWWFRAFLWLAWNRRSYDVIAIQHLRLHALPGLLAGIALRKPMVAKLGRGGAHYDLRRLRAQRLPFGRLVAFLAERSRLVFVANSREIASDLEGSGVASQRIARVPNGVECPPAPAAAYRDERYRQVYVFAGRLSPEKGVLALVDSFRSFAAAGAPVRLRVFGEGPLEPDLRALARDPAFAECLDFRGLSQDRDEIYRGAAYMVLPSTSEGMSNTLLEAMAYGVVPIITKVSGADALVTPAVTGLLLEGADYRQILCGLKRARAMGPAAWGAMSAAARQKVADGFSIERVANAYLELFNRESGAATLDGALANAQSGARIERAPAAALEGVHRSIAGP